METVPIGNAGLLVRRLALLVITLFFLGCSVHRVSEVEVPILLQESFSKSGEGAPQEHWWLEFEDTTLNELMVEALAENLELKMALMRLEQAEALTRIAGAPLLPELVASGEASRARSMATPLQSTRNLFTLDLRLSWEIDLWKRLSSLERAAALDSLAVREMADGVALALSAQLAKEWFALLEQLAQLELLEEQRGVSRTFLDLVELRFGHGAASAVEVYQQREQLASTESLIPPRNLALQLVAQRINVLSGKAPTRESATELIEKGRSALRVSPSSSKYIFSAQLVTLPRLSLPLEALNNRPDVRAAMAGVKAADYRVAAAIAERLPSLRLTSRGGWQEGEIENLGSDFIWGAAANVVGPIFDAGRRRAEVSRRKAILQESLYHYHNRLLLALDDIEGALEKESQGHTLVERLRNQLSYANRAFEESRRRYAMGISEYLPVLSSLLAKQRVERFLLAAQLELLHSRIELYKAIGGGWGEEEEKASVTKEGEIDAP